MKSTQRRNHSFISIRHSQESRKLVEEARDVERKKIKAQKEFETAVKKAEEIQA